MFHSAKPFAAAPVETTNQKADREADERHDRLLTELGITPEQIARLRSGYAPAVDRAIGMARANRARRGL